MACPLPLILTTLLMAMSQPTLAASVISPFAADLPADAYTADAVAGGSAQSVFNGGYWNAGSHGSHWVQADMGATFTLSQVRFSVDVLPANTTTQKIFLSDTPIGNGWVSLTPVASRSDYTVKYQAFALDFPVVASGRYLQVVTNGGSSWAALGDEYARSNWVDPAPQMPAVPEPAALWLMLIGLASVLWSKRPAKAAR